MCSVAVQADLVGWFSDVAHKELGEERNQSKHHFCLERYTVYRRAIA